jgi:flagellar biosynthesis protein FlhG
VDVALGLRPEFNLQHVVAGERTLLEVIAKGPGGLDVVTGGSAVTALMSAGPKRMAAFLDQLNTLADHYDTVIFDTGAGLDNRVMTFVKLVDTVVLVTTPDPTAVTDAYAMAKVAFRRKPGADIRLLVNQVSSDDEGKVIHKTLGTIVGSFLKKDIGWLGSVHADQEAATAIRKKKPFLLAAPKSPASNDAVRVAKQIATIEGKGIAAPEVVLEVVHAEGVPEPRRMAA